MKIRSAVVAFLELDDLAANGDVKHVACIAGTINRTTA